MDRNGYKCPTKPYETMLSAWGFILGERDESPRWLNLLDRLLFQSRSNLLPRCCVAGHPRVLWNDWDLGLEQFVFKSPSQVAASGNLCAYLGCRLTGIQGLPCPGCCEWPHRRNPSQSASAPSSSHACGCQQKCLEQNMWNGLQWKQ